MARRRTPVRSSRPRRCDREGGFGIVEALVAAVVLAVGLLAVAALAGLLARQTARATVRTEQVLAAQQALERMREPAVDPPAGGDTTARVDGREYAVGRTVLPLPGGGRQVTVVVEGRIGVRPETLRARIGPRPVPGGWAWP